MFVRSGSVLSVLFRVLATALVAGTLVGCDSEEAPSSYVARVDDHYLTQSDLDRLMQGMGPVPDSTKAREQVINQWIERTLLFREAKRLNLEEDPEVKRQLQEQRKSTLITAMTNRIYEDSDREATNEEVRTYFESHREQLALREPYVRVRHLATSSADSARTVRRKLLAAREATVDTTWDRLVRTYAYAPDRSQEISERFLPEGRVFSQLPYVQDELSALQEGEVAPITEDNNLFHVLQLVRRVPAGTEPKLKWIKSEIQRRLRIRTRKQMYAREVQRLRNRAKADSLIEMP